jgi:hypothetical protein
LKVKLADRAGTIISSDDFHAASTRRWR